LESAPKAAATHLALTALKALGSEPTSEDALTSEALKLLPPNTTLPEEFEQAIGEL